MVPPKWLCNQHLLGEHSEIHKHRHNFEKGHSIRGRLEPVVLVEPASMSQRHDELVLEMLARGMNHQSPFEQPDLGFYNDLQKYAKVDLDISVRDLCIRCENCKKRIEMFKGNKYE